MIRPVDRCLYCGDPEYRHFSNKKCRYERKRTRLNPNGTSFFSVESVMHLLTVQERMLLACAQFLNLSEDRISSIKITLDNEGDFNGFDVILRIDADGVVDEWIDDHFSKHLPEPLRISLLERLNENPQSAD